MIDMLLFAALATAHMPAPAQPLARVDRANRAALREPSAAGYLHALQQYSYVDGMTYRLYAAPERVTDIALEPGEAITSVAAGDTARWTIADTSSGTGATRRVHILVKPFAEGLQTNLFIATDRRVYRLQLASTTSTAMAAVAWTYPERDLVTIRGSQVGPAAIDSASKPFDPEALNFNYRLSGGKPAWRPLRAFDDGVKIYIEFPAAISTIEAPPLFVLGKDGAAELVNYRMAGRFYVVDRLFEAAELRLGGKRQEIVRITRVPIAPVPKGPGA